MENQNEKHVVKIPIARNDKGQFLKSEIKRICKICGLPNYGNDLCSRHYAQKRIYGKILSRTKYDLNEVVRCSEYGEIVLYNAFSQEIARAKIDPEDILKAINRKWRLDGKGYAITGEYPNILFLHHLIIGRKPGFFTDHINHDKLDNRRGNLRFATGSQNQMNRKNNFGGVTWLERLGKWRARIHVSNNEIHLGVFENREDALKIRKRAEQKYFGEFIYNKN